MDGFFLRALSALFGWVYTLCWSLSFYPQPLLNLRRRSTAGTTVDFPMINIVGFAAYALSNIAFYSSPLIRRQYAARHNGLTPTVQPNDIVFALHALAISLVTASQYLLRPLWRFAPNAGTRPSRFILGVAAGCLLGVLLTVLVVLATASSSGAVDPASRWCELDIVYAVGYVKLAVTLVKYSPQILANWRNASTRGWSIWQILLDLAGGVLSLAQLGIDSYLQRDWSGVTGNPVKLALGNASLGFDSVFVLQHYVLYRSNNNNKESGGAHGSDSEDDDDDENDNRNHNENERLLLPDEEQRQHLD